MKSLMIDAQIRPCYASLNNNVSTRLLKLQINTWPQGTPDFVSHRILNEYIRDTSQKAGVHRKTKYNTKVERIEKAGTKWGVRTSTLSSNCKVSEQLWVTLSPMIYLRTTEQTQVV